jgi:hypothetical protein
MNRRRFLVTSLAGTLATPLAAEAVHRLAAWAWGTGDLKAADELNRGKIPLGHPC